VVRSVPTDRETFHVKYDEWLDTGWRCAVESIVTSGSGDRYQVWIEDESSGKCLVCADLKQGTVADLVQAILLARIYARA
jgi:hypothetical protein